MNLDQDLAALGVGSGPAAPQDAQADWFLAYIVDVVNRADASFPITLTLGGLVISGQLISPAAYYRTLTNSLTTTAADPHARGFAEGVFGAEIAALFAPSCDADGLPAYLHLQDTRILAASGPAHIVPGLLWRGRIASVVGWSAG